MCVHVHVFVHVRACVCMCVHVRLVTRQRNCTQIASERVRSMFETMTEALKEFSKPADRTAPSRSDKVSKDVSAARRSAPGRCEYFAPVASLQQSSCTLFLQVPASRNVV